MARALAFLILIAGCDSFTAIPCGECEKHGAVCNPTTNTCQLPADMGLDACGPNCDMPPGDMPPMACTAATAAQDCTNPSAPICGMDGKCRACNGAGDDAACAMRSAGTPRCMPTGAKAGQCVACIPGTPAAESADCSGANAPVCQDDSTCRACRAHSECVSKVCVFDGATAGTCVPATQVALVDNGNAAVATCTAGRPTRNGNSAATAYCDVSEAIAEAAMRSFILVKGSGQPYGNVTITDRSLTILGPGKAATPTARLFTVGSPSANVTVNSGARLVVLDGLDLGGDSIMKALRGVSCTNNTGTATNASIIVRDSRLHDSAMEGMLATSCASTIEASIITTNTAGGLSISGGDFKVANNLIIDNGTSGPGVIFAGNLGSGLFWFNTVAGNLRTGGQAGALNCGGVLSGNPLIQASVIWGNTKTGAGASVTAGCTFTHSDFDDSPLPAGTGNFSMDPLFINAGTGNYHLQAGSPCKNKVTTATGLTGGTLPARDVDGDPRPRAATGGFDVGADQVVP